MSGYAGKVCVGWLCRRARGWSCRVLIKIPGWSVHALWVLILLVIAFSAAAYCMAEISQVYSAIPQAIQEFQMLLAEEHPTLLCDRTLRFLNQGVDNVNTFTCELRDTAQVIRPMLYLAHI